MEIAISGWELAEPHFLVEELTDRVRLPRSPRHRVQRGRFREVVHDAVKLIGMKLACFFRPWKNRYVFFSLKALHRQNPSG